MTERERLVKLIDQSPAHFCDICRESPEERAESIEMLADYLIASDVAEVLHGTWYRETERGVGYAKCSACGRKMNYSCYGYAYCSMCGARMEGERR
jgi:hypothetical protein